MQPSPTSRPEDALDRWVREVVDWHFDPLTGTPFWLEFAQKQGVSLNIKEGGGQIEYEDQDPRIHRLWLEEMRKNGVTPKMEGLVPSKAVA